jgi:hypothetical protein
MSEPNKLQIGQIITTPQKKDAIHVAIAPVMAGIILKPGDRVYIEDDKAYDVGISLTPPDGVVDPFLKNCVHKGELFWVFLFPGTATNLRHEWDHPAFVEKNEETEDIEDDPYCRGC